MVIHYGYARTDWNISTQLRTACNDLKLLLNAPVRSKQPYEGSAFLRVTLQELDKAKYHFLVSQLSHRALWMILNNCTPVSGPFFGSVQSVTQWKARAECGALNPVNICTLPPISECCPLLVRLPTLHSHMTPVSSAARGDEKNGTGNDVSGSVVVQFIRRLTLPSLRSSCHHCTKERSATTFN